MNKVTTATISRRRSPASVGSGGRLARRLKTTVGTAALLLIAVYVIAPIYWLVVASSKNAGQLFNLSLIHI